MSQPPHDKRPSTIPSTRATFTSLAADSSSSTPGVSRPTQPVTYPASRTSSATTEITHPRRHHSSADYWSTVLNQVNAPSTRGASSASPRHTMAPTGAHRYPPSGSSTSTSQPFASGLETEGKHRTAGSSHVTTGTYGPARSESFHMGPIATAGFPSATWQMASPAGTHPIYPNLRSAPPEPSQQQPRMQADHSYHDPRARHQRQPLQMTPQLDQLHADDWVLSPPRPPPLSQQQTHAARPRFTGSLGASTVVGPLPSVPGGGHQGPQLRKPRASDPSEVPLQHPEDEAAFGGGGNNSGDNRSDRRSGEESGFVPPLPDGAGVVAGPSRNRSAGRSSSGPLKKFRCPICDHLFERRGHLQQHVDSVHNNYNRFQCPVCSRGFGHRSSMQRHIKKLHEGP